MADEALKGAMQSLQSLMRFRVKYEELVKTIEGKRTELMALEREAEVLITQFEEARSKYEDEHSQAMSELLLRR